MAGWKRAKIINFQWKFKAAYYCSNNKSPHSVSVLLVEKEGLYIIQICMWLLHTTYVDCTGRGLWCTKRLLNWKMKSLFQLLCLDDIFSIVMNRGSKTIWVLKVGSYGNLSKTFFHCLPKFWHIWRFIKLEQRNLEELSHTVKNPYID